MLLSFLHPKGNKINFLRYKARLIIISMSFVVVSLLAFSLQGLNLGIDFLGGILIEAKLPPEITVGEIRSQLKDVKLGDITLQEFGQADIILIRIQRQPGGASAQQSAITLIKETLGENVVEYRRVESVGPTFSKELQTSAILAIILTMVGIFIYIWFRFEWQFGIGAILALLHDVITTIGLFSLLQLEVNIATVASILTIAGYSINDTVVIYDRVRENLRKYKHLELAEVYNISLNQVLSRSVLTTITTLLALLALVFLGGAVIRDFAIPLIWGVLFGTYSSIGFAVPFIHYFPPHNEDIS